MRFLNQAIIDAETKLKKNIVRLLLLTACGSIIFGLPYFRWSFYEPFAELYQLSNEQLGMLGSVYGFFGLISYLLGGVLADRFSAKKLIYFSLIATGIGGFIHYYTTSYSILLALYAIWGLTSLLTFWPALIKAVRLTGGSGEQSRVFGIFEGGRGIVYSAYDSIAVVVFGIAVSHGVADIFGLKYAILYYSIVTTVFGVLCIFILENTETASKQIEKFKWGNVITAMKLPAVWMVALILCCTYSMNISYSYFNPYAVNVFGFSSVMAATLTIMAQWVRPVAAPTAGFLADRFGRPNMMLFGFGTMATVTAIIILLPSGTNNIMFFTLCAIVYIAMFMNYGVVLSLMDEGGIPLEISGTAIGIVCTIGYLPEVLCPTLAGKTLDSFNGAAGFQLYFSMIVLMMAVGMCAILVWTKIYSSKSI